jgi:hypothetical protein
MRAPLVQKAAAAPQQLQERPSTEFAPETSAELVHAPLDASPRGEPARQLQSLVDASPRAAQMKAIQAKLNPSVLQRAGGKSNGVAQLDELDDIASHANPNYVEGSEEEETKNKYSSTPKGKFSATSSEDKRKQVAKNKAEEEASGKFVPHQPVADLGELYAHNSMLKPEYDNQVQAIAAATGGSTKFRSGEGMKSLGRTLEKITADYGGDASRIIDLTGASIYYNSVDELVKGYQAVEANSFFNVVRVKNSLMKADGYGDINIAVEMGSADFDIEVDGVKKKEHYAGFIIELQLHLTAILEKKEQGHKQYEEQRTITAQFPGHDRKDWKAGEKGVTQKDIDNYDRLDAEMKAIYAKGWSKLISWREFLDPRIEDKLASIRTKLATIQPKG